MKTAAEMRRLAEASQNTDLVREREKIQRLIEEAARRGQTKATFYDPISDAMFRELVAAGYYGTAKSHAGRNETEWNVTIDWSPRPPVVHDSGHDQRQNPTQQWER